MRAVLVSSILAVVLVAACAPATPPGPTAVPTKPAAPTAAPAAKPTEAPAAKPADTPAARPAEKPATAASPKAAEKPAAKEAFDEKAVADFYREKTVRIIVGTGAGGGHDVNSRLIARHMAKYIPGNPTVIVENMPGAASMVALNHIANVAPQDGTVIIDFLGGAVLQQLFGNPSVQFDVTKLQYLGSPGGTTYTLFVGKDTGITRFEELLAPRGKDVSIGTDNPGSSVHDTTVMLPAVLGATFKVVTGYSGTARLKLAMEAGEIHGYIDSWESLKVIDAERLSKGELVILVQYTEQPTMDFPAYPSKVPGILTFAKDEEQRQILRYGGIVPTQFSRPYAVSAQVPADRAKALEAAFQKTLADREFVAEAAKVNLEVKAMTGEQLRKLNVDFMAMPAGVRDKLKPILQPAGR